MPSTPYTLIDIEDHLKGVAILSRNLKLCRDASLRAVAILKGYGMDSSDMEAELARIEGQLAELEGRN